ncbi:MAG: hypothetical protein WD011_07830, partial [Nitriliruptoraceae bacterium]
MYEPEVLDPRHASHRPTIDAHRLVGKSTGAQAVDKRRDVHSGWRPNNAIMDIAIPVDYSYTRIRHGLSSVRRAT